MKKKTAPVQQQALVQKQLRMGRIRFGIPSLDTLMGKAKTDERLLKYKYLITRCEGRKSNPQGFDHNPQKLDKTIASLTQVIGSLTENKIDIPMEADDLGIPLTDDAITICIAGTSGVGKSILALHLASRYAADTYSYENSKVFYVSTDWSHSQAEKVWKDFKLDKTVGILNDAPENIGGVNIHGIEREPFWGLDDPVLPPILYQLMDVSDCKLKPSKPRGIPDILAPSSDPDVKREKLVHFIDLKSDTAGDDWQFINNLIGQLPYPDYSRAPEPGETDKQKQDREKENEEDNKQGKHLVIVDAIEGLEALSGNQDSFGNNRTRRSRITQLIRNADKKCHLVFMVEGGIERDLPEQYAADVVLRLRNATSQDGQYMRRTIEVEKARGDAHVRGQHILQIRRGGRGSTTGEQMNMDDPATDHSYVHVVPGLDLIARETMWQRGTKIPESDPTRVADFGIRYLDDMLRTRSITHETRYKSRDRGLPSGSVTALTGDDGTQKSRLVKAFAGRGFVSYASETETQDGQGNTTSSESKVRLWIEKLNPNQRNVIAKAKGKLRKDYTKEESELYGLLGEAVKEQAKSDPLFTVFFTTQDVDNAALARYAARHVTRRGRRWAELTIHNKTEALGSDAAGVLMDWFAEAIQNYFICRRLERHNISPSGLFYIIRQSIRQAQHEIYRHFSGASSNNKSDWVSADRRFYLTDERIKIGHKIRVVIEDWQIIRDIYPEVRNDDQFLGLLLFYLARQGVTTLVAHTRPGQPDVLPDQDDNRLQKEAHHNLRTWRARFGEIDKVAIAAIPPISYHLGSVTRELKWEGSGDDDNLTVDPMLELYQGVRDGHGQPRLTPLRIRLNAESQSVVSYARRMERLLQEKFPSTDTPDIRVTCSGTELGGSLQSYENLRDLCHLQGDIPLNHSLVFMVDEFWTMLDKSSADKGKGSRLRDMSEYLSGATWEKGRGQDRVNDPDNLFQPTETVSFVPATDLTPGDTTSKTSLNTYETLNRAHFFGLNGPGSKSLLTDRVPFFQNFGFFLCRENAWKAALKEDLVLKRDKQTDTDDERSQYYKVEDVWNSLSKLSGHREHKKFPAEQSSNKAKERENISWRQFLEASAIVAKLWSSREHHLLPLDMSRHSMESLSCLVLEMWASEIYTDKFKASESHANIWAEKLTERSWTQDISDEGLVKWLVGSHNISDGKALTQQLKKSVGNVSAECNKGSGCPGYTFALYRTLMLLSEVLTWETLSRTDNPFQEGSGNTSPVGAASSRVWYTTASAQQGTLAAFRKTDQVGTPDFDKDDPLVMMMMPGNFSTRGDWYLAVSSGGTSTRLSERAVDILSSFTNNVARLEGGIGLPARINKDEIERYKPVRTPLMTFKKYQPDSGDEKRPSYYPVPARYEDVMNLMPGGYAQENWDKDRFFCLWRSKLYDYDRHARIFQKWILRELEFRIRLRQRAGAGWINCFHFYDEQINFYRPTCGDDGEGGYFYLGNDSEYKTLNSWERFCERVGDLLNALRGATISKI